MRRSRTQRPVIVVGGGLTGIAAALHLERPYALYERDDELGGLARTSTRDGFSFDCTGHWLHLRDASVKAWIAAATGDLLATVERQARVYLHGRLTPYPFQGNLFGLPPAVVAECLLGVFEAAVASQGGATAPQNFEEFIRFHFGDGIAKHFMLPYNEKLWGVAPKELTSAWCDRFVPLPDVAAIIAGAVGAGVAQLGYNVRFQYPRQGGIGALTQALAQAVDPRTVFLGSPVERVFPQSREVVIGDRTVPYDALIATLPLPHLVQMLTDIPESVRTASNKLRATPVRYFNIAARSTPPSDYHWVYVPEPRLPFYRVGITSNAMSSMAPPGCASLYVELASRAAVDDEQALLAQVAEGLVEIKALRSPADIAFAELRTIDPAYVIFDAAYRDATKVIHDYLATQRIYACGRYGAWIYNAMEDSLIAGRDIAQRVNRLEDR